MNREMFETELQYQTTRIIAKKLRSMELLTEEEYADIEIILLKKYRPILGTLLSGKPLT